MLRPYQQHSDCGVVLPNNDTLYSSGWYDLRCGDLQIDVPPMDHADRYWIVMIVDAYDHVAYVCRRHHGVGGTRVRVTYDPIPTPPNDASRIVPIGTPTAWVILRVLVETSEDLVNARKLQRAISVTRPPGTLMNAPSGAARPQLSPLPDTAAIYSSVQQAQCSDWVAIKRSKTAPTPPNRMPTGRS